MHLLKWKELYSLKILLHILCTVTSNKYKWSDTLMRKECDQLNLEEPLSDPSSQRDPTTPILLRLTCLMLMTNAHIVFISFILKISKFKFRNFPEGNNYASLHIQAQKWTSSLFLQDLLLAWGRSKYVIRLTHVKLSH